MQTLPRPSARRFRLDPADALSDASQASPSELPERGAAQSGISRRRLELVAALSQRLSVARSRGEVAEILLPTLKERLGADQAFFITLDRNTGRPTVFGGTHEDRVSLGSRLRSLPFPELREALRSGVEILPATYRIASPVAAGMVEEGVIVLTGSGPFPEEDVRLLASVGAFLGVLLRNLGLCTEVEAAYTELRERRRETAHRERLEALGQLSSGIVHDINNALSPITAFSSLLLSDADEHGEETLRLLRLIYRAGNDVAEMLGRMRDFSRTREDERPMAPVDTATLLEEVVQLTGPRVRTASLLSGNEYNVVAEPVPGTRPVLGHDHELREALLNLVLNGIDALQNDLDAVLLVARPARGEDDPGGDTRGFVAIEVADTGSGMSPDTLRRCMEPFFTTKGEEGTGLGMGQVKAVVQRHGGRLFVESEEGRGTRVRLLLPASSGMRLASGGTGGEDTPRLRVLAVDDDAVQRTVLEAVLRRQGHECTVVGGGREAVEEFVRARQCDRPYHVVITDLGMPDVDGRGVIRAVREVSPDARIILLTGWTAGIPGQGLPDGVDRLLAKPLRPEQLAEALQAVSAPSEGEERR